MHTTKMQIYKVSRKSRHGCDQFSAFICFAPDEKTALSLNPLYPEIGHPFFQSPPPDYHLSKFYRWGSDNQDGDYWVADRDDLTVELIGSALPTENRVGVVLASYHAG